MVVCDNTLNCVAKGFSDDNASGVEIRIERDAGPASKLIASISAVNKFGLADIRVDGVLLSLPNTAWQIESSDDETSVTSDDLNAVRALVQHLRNEAKVTLAGTGEVPLDGFAAAMLRLDARQGRTGGVTALIKVGPALASSVPAAPPLPKIATTSDHGNPRSRRGASADRDGRALFAKEEYDAKPIVMDPEAHALDAR